ncbi:MAG: hypothetical protein HY673_22475 [Chloroflexi bacterium]|nr:hypothetical protein [Chloroflexota bacterium]
MYLTIFTWWLWLELLSVIALPFAFALFRNLPDRGYPLAKIVGVLFPSYLLWLGASLHVIANRRWSIFLILVVLCVFGALLARRHWSEMKSFVARNVVLIVVVEAIFLGGVVLWAVIRAYDPFILLPERPVNFLFINAIMRSAYMPPPDPWFSGFSLNYYYFGHFMVATLTKLAGMSTAITYNLSMGWIFASAAVGVFSLAFNLTRGDGTGRSASCKAILAGLAGIVFLLFISNLEGFLEFLYAHNMGSADFWKWIGIKGMTTPYSSVHWYPTEPEWWFRSVRVIDTLTPEGASLDLTFNDYPFYNLMAGYIHAHLIAVPLALAALGVGLNFLLDDRPWGWEWFRENWCWFLAASAIVGSLGVTNTWDLATYGLFIVCLFFVQGYFHRKGQGWLGTVIVSAGMLTGAFLLFIPYYNAYQPYSGLRPWLGPGTRNLHWFLFLGFFVSVLVPFLIVIARPFLKKSFWKPLALATIPLIAPFAVWILAGRKAGITPVTPSIGVKLFNMWPLLALLLLTMGLLLSKVMDKERRQVKDRIEIFVLLCIFGALYIVYGTDLFWFKDAVMGGRANTIFKFYYHVWVLLALASAYGVHYLLFVWKPSPLPFKIDRVFVLVIVGLLLAASLLYAPAALMAKTNFFKATPTLDGLSFLPAPDREYIDWFNDNVPGTPVVIEASNIWSLEEARVAVRTGLPTLLGPAGAEKSWRGDYDREFMARIKDLEIIYQSDDLQKVQSLLTRYQAQYIVLGGLETVRYGPGIKERFDGWFEKAFANGAATIYKASPSTLLPARSPKAVIVEMFYRDAITGDYRPLSTGAELSEHTYHFNAKIRNTGQEKVTVYLDVTQSDGVKLSPWGAPEWDLPPGPEIALFVQGSNLRPPGKSVQMSFSLREKGSNRVLDTKVVTVRSK